MSGTHHVPVLLEEAIEYLRIEPHGTVVDATLNGGGHSRAILERFPEVRVIGIELDPVLIEGTRRALAPFGTRFEAVRDTYAHLRTIVSSRNVVPDGVLFDLGLSSWHYTASGRGFSFQNNEPLDMRFNPESGEETAAQIVNVRSQDELATILREYGEEQHAEAIADAIVEARRTHPIMDTERLVQVITSAVPAWYTHKKIHHATKTFQALRIAVNHEIENVHAGIEAAIDAVRPGGRIVAISFHGIEDKAVREVFKAQAAAGVVKWVTKDTIRPSWKEVQANPRARSAKMKIAEKLGVEL